MYAMRQGVREDNLTICYGETNNLQNYREILPYQLKLGK